MQLELSAILSLMALIFFVSTHFEQPVLNVIFNTIPHIIMLHYHLPFTANFSWNFKFHEWQVLLLFARHFPSVQKFCVGDGVANIWNCSLSSATTRTLHGILSAQIEPITERNQQNSPPIPSCLPHSNDRLQIRCFLVILQMNSRLVVRIPAGTRPHREDSTIFILWLGNPAVAQLRTLTVTDPGFPVGGAPTP